MVSSWRRDGVCGFILTCLRGGVTNQMRWGGALPHGAASLGAWRSTSNLFAVIAVRVYTLESSNSLFYFSHHEGDHLSSCLHFPPPFGVRSLLVRTRTHTHTHTHTQAQIQTQHAKISVWDTRALIHHTFVQPASHDWRTLECCFFTRCWWGWPRRRHMKGKSCPNNESHVTQFPICWLVLFIQFFPEIWEA